MARPKSALRQKLEEIALAHAHAAAAAAAATAPEGSSPAYTDSNSDATSGATPSSDTTGATPASTTSSATTISTCTWPAVDEEERARIASELERLSALGPEQINKRNWDFSSHAWQEMMSCVAPDFLAYWDNFPRALSFDENIAGSRMLVERDPGYCMVVEQMESDVDEVHGKASVFMQLRVMEGGVTFQGMSTLTWERDDGGRWMCSRHDGYRGLNAGFD